MTVGESNTEINAITPFWVGQYSTPIVGQFSMPIYKAGSSRGSVRFELGFGTNGGLHQSSGNVA